MDNEGGLRPRGGHRAGRISADGSIRGLRRARPTCRSIIREDDRYPLHARRSSPAWADGPKGTPHGVLFYREMRKRYSHAHGRRRQARRRRLEPTTRRTARRCRSGSRRRTHRFIAPNKPSPARRHRRRSAMLFPQAFRHAGGLRLRHHAGRGRAHRHRLSLPTSCPASATTKTPWSRGEPWMWHAIISAAMNLGLIDPLDVCRPRRGRVPRRPRATECGGGLHPADHRLARVHARHLLAEDAGFQAAQCKLGAERASCRGSTGPAETDMICVEGNSGDRPRATTPTLTTSSA